MVALIAVVGMAYIHTQTRTLPDVNAQYLATHEPSKIVDKDDNIIWQSPNNHTVTMAYDEIPTLYQDALIAVEDDEYWETPGYSLSGIANAIYTTVASQFNDSIVPRGGSTLDQQLIKNVYFNGGQNIKTTTRKIQEIYLAAQLNTNFSKEEILEFYVNHLSFAEGATGTAGVMRVYFGKGPSDYTEKTIENIAQIAYMVGLNQNPTLYNAYTEPKNADERKDTVLYVMKDKGLITDSEYEKALDYKIGDHIQERNAVTHAIQESNLTYKNYTDEVINRVGEMGYDLDNITLTIHTFLDRKEYKAITDTVRKDQYYPDGTVREQQVAVSVMDTDGIVRALVGSRHDGDELNRATQRTRSSGSALKQFTAYAPLLEYFGSQYTTASQFSSAPYTYPGTNRVMNNWGNLTYGKVDIQRALRSSMNTPVARIADEVLGSARMKTFLHGVRLDYQDSYAALDAVGLYVSTLDSAAALNALNNGGIYTEPRFIQSIEFTDGSVRKIEPIKHRAMNESTAWVINQMLRGVVTDGYTGQDGRIDKYEGYAAKTGTVGVADDSSSPNVYGNGGSDSWFNTYTNNGYNISIWYGYDIPNKSPRVAEKYPGIKYMGRDLQLQLNKNSEIPNWNKPAAVETISGKGLDAHYKVTDSKDLGSEQLLTIPDIYDSVKNFTDIKSVSPQKNADLNWIDKLSEPEQAIYQYITEHPDWSESLDIIDKDLYHLLRGSNDE